MNCSLARNRLLALPEPSAVPDAVAVHLNECASCQAWHVLLIQVEGVVAHLPLPASTGKRKQQLMRQFSPAVKQKKSATKSDPRLKQPKPAKPVEKSAAEKPATIQPATRVPLGERLARFWPAGIVAAAVLVGAMVWTIFGGKKANDPLLVKNPPDPMLKEVVSAKTKLDTAPNTATRVDVLAKLADTIHDEARSISKVTPEEMYSLATMYKQVVQEALVPQARSLSQDERKVTLPKYAQRLGEAEQEANRLAAESPVGSDRALRDIAEAARAGRIELAKLIQGRAT